ncbi:hypothetical protein EP331_15565 [bacterium]|nr:MAG: hypothetical protein EP331_15565 [bacterium]
MKNSLKLIALLTLFVSCDFLESDNNYTMQYVVESYLVANEEFPPVVLTKTLPIDEVYSLERAAVTSGKVKVYELDDQSNKVDSVTYFRDLNAITVYYAIGSKTVKPETLYRIEIIVENDNNHKITAETFVPGSFNAVAANSDSVVYQSNEQLEVNYTQSYYPNRQSYYILTVVAQDTTGDLTPFYQQAIDSEDGPTRTEFQRNSSGILNQGNFDINPDQTITIRLPWLAVAYYGDHIIEANTIDDNLYDFLRTEGAQFGGGTLSPGEIYDIIDHIEGGTGVFGSYYQVKTPVFIKRNPDID